MRDSDGLRTLLSGVEPAGPGRAADRERCAAAGMDDFISKPVADSELLRVLGKWIPDVPISIGSLEIDRVELNALDTSPTVRALSAPTN